MRTPETYRVLVVDNHPDIHAVFRKILEAEDGLASQWVQVEAEVPGTRARGRPAPRFEVDCTRQGEEGLTEVMRALQAERPYSVAFVEARLPPGWDGIETIGHLWKADPALEVVLCTSVSDYSLQDSLRQARRTDHLLVLKTPFDDI